MKERSWDQLQRMGVTQLENQALMGVLNRFGRGPLTATVDEGFGRVGNQPTAGFPTIHKPVRCIVTSAYVLLTKGSTPAYIPRQRLADRFCRNWLPELEKRFARFKSHENSALHRAASTALTAFNVGLNVASALSESKQSQMKESRKALMAILSSIRFLAFQGLALRGHDDDEGNLKQLLLLREADVPGLAAWLNRTGYKWISGDIQNEMFELITQSMLRSLMKEVHGAGFYAVIADETSDITTQEQVSFCFRYAKENLEVEEVFVGFYATADTRARTLFRSKKKRKGEKASSKRRHTSGSSAEEEAEELSLLQKERERSEELTRRNEKLQERVGALESRNEKLQDVLLNKLEIWFSRPCCHRRLSLRIVPKQRGPPVAVTAAFTI
ncbi:uncharacterized protein LOC125756631, partial [Rhipicephalus sanguineus]|uniref:uncharacterized protein LOC125756631 n=1 Tax=Rhipicephalus sanguineus TaxID=34632 RepID=UPI0020C42BF4